MAPFVLVLCLSVSLSRSLSHSLSLFDPLCLVKCAGGVYNILAVIITCYWTVQQTLDRCIDMPAAALCMIFIM